MDADLLIPKLDRPASQPEPLGAVLRRTRKTQAMSLTSLSDAAAVSAASLSRIENGRMSPTFEVVVRICDALGLTITGLMSGRDVAQGGLLTGVVRTLQTAQYHYEVLGHTDGAAPFVTLRTRILCQSLASFGEMHSHRGFEQIVVQSGCIAVHLGSRRPHLLEEGESIAFDSTTPHAVVAPHGAASVLWIYAPGGQR
ncbi:MULTISPECIES: helix-turn-helix domain-containing protein [Roseobacteraceae]|uniref:Transcriptional regulator ClgR n=1 Tax=Pseudosulfitobacter pseudonitzschiae TaxID=1402135 RepID=A0A221K7P2_9RHOB|nr:MULTISPECIES: XRE family transcriptional regulator [Roseobacteraceae]ASM75032.1 transcriptional regulator ClgR [Pseudosulfitobacter pseudonitzschiae]